MLTGETVTFKDADGHSWEFDLTFMLSNYHCIWRNGCPDVMKEGTDRGCCIDGVAIYDGESDAAALGELETIRGRVAQLTDEDWQNRQAGDEPWRHRPVGQGALGAAQQRPHPHIPRRVRLSQPPRPSWRPGLRPPCSGAQPWRGPDGLEADDLLAGSDLHLHRR